MLAEGWKEQQPVRLLGVHNSRFFFYCFFFYTRCPDAGGYQTQLCPLADSDIIASERK